MYAYNLPNIQYTQMINQSSHWNGLGIPYLPELRAGSGRVQRAGVRQKLGSAPYGLY